VPKISETGETEKCLEDERAGPAEEALRKTDTPGLWQRPGDDRVNKQDGG